MQKKSKKVESIDSMNLAVLDKNALVKLQSPCSHVGATTHSNHNRALLLILIAIIINSQNVFISV